ncbi:MAG: hypothetical protein H6843_04345 [Rhodospirillaceae bacterium]|nr:hypothetical protein [Rhodospirillaceae bacterium]
MVFALAGFLPAPGRAQQTGFSDFQGPALEAAPQPEAPPAAPTLTASQRQQYVQIVERINATRLSLDSSFDGLMQVLDTYTARSSMTRERYDNIMYLYAAYTNQFLQADRDIIDDIIRLDPDNSPEFSELGHLEADLTRHATERFTEFNRRMDEILR